MEYNIIKEYQKQRARVKALVKRYEKRGYIFLKPIVPAIPKTKTSSSVEKLSRITPELVRSRARTIDTTTGEVVKPKEFRRKKPTLDIKKGRKNEPRYQGNIKGNTKNLVHKGNIKNLNRKGRKKGAKDKKPRKQRVKYIPSKQELTIQSFRDYMNEVTKDFDIMIGRNMMNTYLDFILKQYGEDKVAKAIEDTFLDGSEWKKGFDWYVLRNVYYTYSWLLDISNNLNQHLLPKEQELNNLVVSKIYTSAESLVFDKTTGETPMQEEGALYHNIKGTSSMDWINDKEITEKIMESIDEIDWGDFMTEKDESDWEELPDNMSIDDFLGD